MDENRVHDCESVPTAPMQVKCIHPYPVSCTGQKAPPPPPPLGGKFKKAMSTAV